MTRAGGGEGGGSGVWGQGGGGYGVVGGGTTGEPCFICAHSEYCTYIIANTFIKYIVSYFNQGQRVDRYTQ